MDNWSGIIEVSIRRLTLFPYSLDDSWQDSLLSISVGTAPTAAEDIIRGESIAGIRLKSDRDSGAFHVWIIVSTPNQIRLPTIGNTYLVVFFKSQV